MKPFFKEKYLNWNKKHSFNGKRNVSKIRTKTFQLDCINLINDLIAKIFHQFLAVQKIWLNLCKTNPDLIFNKIQTNAIELVLNDKKSVETIIYLYIILHYNIFKGKLVFHNKRRIILYAKMFQ